MRRPSRSAFAAAIERGWADRDFTTRARAVLERNGDLLDRLAR